MNSKVSMIKKKKKKKSVSLMCSKYTSLFIYIRVIIYRLKCLHGGELTKVQRAGTAMDKYT